jgi:hypothetical protein
MVRSAAELVCRFESLGSDCEFGFLQRRAGAEPMGLLRFASMPFDGLLRALRTRFAGLTEPGNLHLWTEHGEPRITARNYRLTYHTEYREAEITQDELFRIESRKVAVLAAKLVEDLRRQRKIFVYQQHTPMQARDLVALLGALGRYGPVTLLWVVEADAEHQPGTVELINERLMVGHLKCFAPGGNVHLPDFASWIEICRAAWQHWSAARPEDAAIAAGPTPSCPALACDVDFGIGGNGPSYQMDGWSVPEPGFTWTIGKESSLMLPRNTAGALQLTLFVRPYVNRARLPVQRLSVAADGAEIAAFDLTGYTMLRCPIPATPRSRWDRIHITFRHPDAARPSRHDPAHKDARELAIAFRRITLDPVGDATVPSAAALSLS